MVTYKKVKDGYRVRYKSREWKYTDEQMLFIVSSVIGWADKEEIPTLKKLYKELIENGREL